MSEKRVGSVQRFAGKALRVTLTLCHFGFSFPGEFSLLEVCPGWSHPWDIEPGAHLLHCLSAPNRDAEVSGNSEQ